MSNNDISNEKLKEIVRLSYKEIDKWNRKETATKDAALDAIIKIIEEVVDSDED